MKLQKNNRLLNKSQSIRLYCLECGGCSPKEVTLCSNADCPLWQYRFGYSAKDKRYKKRMESAERNYPAEYKEILKLLSNSNEK